MHKACTMIMIMINKISLSLATISKIYFWSCFTKFTLRIRNNTPGNRKSAPRIRSCAPWTKSCIFWSTSCALWIRAELFKFSDALLICIEPVKIGHVDTNYASSVNRQFLSNGTEYLCSVTCTIQLISICNRIVGCGIQD